MQIAEKHDPILEVSNLRTHFPIVSGILRRKTGTVKAVDGVSFKIQRRETYGLVGESGCGKSTLAHTLMQGHRATEGEILLHRNDGKVLDVTKANRNQLRAVRRHMQMVLQDPYTSLNPRMTIRDIIGEPLVINTKIKKKELEERVKQLLVDVGLSREYLIRYPHAFSGGQRQRISVARALTLNPSLIIGDEPVSALDVSVQAQVLNLFKHLQNEFDLTYLLITHDLSVVEHMCNRVAVMYVGRIVEESERGDLFENPQHPYTEALLSSVPVADPHVRSQEIVLEGEVADPSNPPSGCYFHPRCRYAVDVCRRTYPELRTTTDGHRVACHRAEELSLSGVKAMVERNENNPGP